MSNTARIELLASIDTARRHWHHDTEPQRTRYQHAGDELARRGLSRDPDSRPAEQLPLLALDHDTPSHRAQHERPAETTNTSHTDRAPRDHQEPLFSLTPHARDIAAAQPLRATSTNAAQASHGATLADAYRQAEISTNLRAQRLEWTATVEQLVAELNGLDEHEDYGYDTDHDLNQHQDQDQDLDEGVGW